MSAAEFTLQFAAYAKEPWGDLRDDFRTGIIAATVFNTTVTDVNKAASPADYLLFEGKKKKPPPDEPDVDAHFSRFM